MNVGETQATSRIWRLTAVFALALIVRLVYNLYIAQHRIVDVGDSFYYLTAGRTLAKLVRESQSIEVFFSQLCAGAQYVPGSFNSFSSLGLSDRLLIDGPIYPSYLAAIFLITGKALETAAFNASQLTFAIANSLTDSLLAVVIAFLGEISFGVAAGVLAGVLWSFYLPAVINTQQCYGEPVVALILSAFLAALFYQSKQCGKRRDSEGKGKPDLLLSLLVGWLAGLVMLAKPAFVLLPPLMLALHLIAMAFAGRLRGRAFSAASLLLGTLIALTPWLLYTSTVSGAPRLIVNRAPGYNLYIGNFLPTDGWKTCPVVEGIPDSVVDARRYIDSEIERRPAEFFSLLLRKIPRLWAGVWNDFHSTAFGISYKWQNIGQALYQFLFIIGLAVGCAGRLKQTRSFSFCAAMTLGYAVAFHYIYVLFEPVPRYAFTAMPLVIVLAAGGLSLLAMSVLSLGKKERRRFIFQSVCLIAFFAILASAFYSFSFPVALFWSVCPASWDLRVVLAGVFALLFLLLGYATYCILRTAKISGPISAVVLIKCFTITALIAAACALSDPAFLEWDITLPKEKSLINLPIDLPNIGKDLPPKIYILADVQAKTGAPALAFTVNGHEIETYGLPLYELTSASPDIPKLINLQSRNMDVDSRTFRQWWVFPVDTRLFTFNGLNTITIDVKGRNQVRVFGDYGKPLVDTTGGESCSYPSLTTFSWSKGFLTAECLDPRVYESTYFRGRAHVAVMAGRTAPGYNSLGGKEFPGVLRVRLAVPMLGRIDSEALGRPVQLFGQQGERQILGQYPIVFDCPMISLEEPLAQASVLHFQAQMRRRDVSVPATMALALEHDGDRQLFNSAWQPSCLRLDRDWQDVDFKTLLPAKADGWKTLRAHLLLSPFPGDRLYLHQKEALRDKIEVRDIKIEILPPPIPGGGAKGALKLL
ncbi:MAG: hypothetical protein JSS86_03580 [Cyanobacteria bacterium SZAS LIN-2]|nr:hypothetical protein [Cyanobacteria bacterium SZAS LIN-3]MBS1995360.1 hypothetical protein [Cyanobacteria bacterium SZAS LIN-2]